MDRLHQAIGIVMLLLDVQFALASNYCSLHVDVRTPNNLQPQEVIITVKEVGGRILQKETNGGIVNFCDLGIHPVTVTVGSDSCNQVTVRDVPIDWKSEYVLKVTYDPEPCFLESPPAPDPFCQVLIRVSDSKGRWIENASLDFRDTKWQSSQLTDNAGRAMRLVRRNERARGTVKANGFRSKPFSIKCGFSNPITEKLLKLESNRGQR